ncbi:MAG: protease complex subunit PrcB family protein [Candidatus Bathyarchaeota archaeon]|nr:protease complex subunit PrcB family protein [Candidatus Bathyarchaeota archaeon]
MVKHPIVIATVSLLTLAVLIGSIIYFSPPSNPQTPDILLNLDNLTASTDGQVSFNVTLDEAESATLESVKVNDTTYSWSDGSQENSTILKGETKQWSINIGTLLNGTNIQVTVEAPPKTTTKNTTVQSTTDEPPSSDNPNYVYDQYGGVGLFPEGIHVIATSQDPTTLIQDYDIVNDYWTMLKQHETTTATDQDFISIILSRGDQNTGGYAINVESFGWLECYPPIFRFHVNITDPGEGLMVTQAITNPLVLAPITKLTPGEYHIEVHVTWFTENVDDQGNTYYTPIMTFAPIVWEQTLIITGNQEPDVQSCFGVTVNGNPAQNLTVQVDLTDGITETEAKQITNATFVQTMGNEVLYELDTIDFDETQITAHYTWGYDQNDMGHVFDLVADLQTMNISVTHCR